MEKALGLMRGMSSSSRGSGGREAGKSASTSMYDRFSRVQYWLGGRHAHRHGGSTTTRAEVVSHWQPQRAATD